jgi:HSP20 family protein
MLDSLKQSGDYVGRKTSQTWKDLPEGWRELFCQSNNALTYFSSSNNDGQTQRQRQDTSPRWSLLAAEIEESDKELLVKIEVPGLEKEDCHLTVQSNKLCLSGIKRLGSKGTKNTRHISERAYGSFQRCILLPLIIDQYKARASYRNGVLTVFLPKIECKPPISIQLS